MSRRPGFSLTEFVVVIVILAVGAAAAVPAYRSLAADEDELDEAVRRLEAVFRTARDSAIRGALPVTVVIDSATGAFWLDSPAREPLPPADDDPFDRLRLMAGSPQGAASAARAAGVAGVPTGAAPPTPLELPAAVRLEVRHARAAFTFRPSGAVFADSLVLRSGDRAVPVTLDPWTGDVVVR